MVRHTDWFADRESFRREWDAAAKWRLKYRPKDEETALYYGALQQSAAAAADPAATTTVPSPEGIAAGAAQRKRIHIRHKHKRVCPDAEQRRQAEQPCGRQTPTAGAGADATSLGERAVVVESNDNTTMTANANGISNRAVRQQPITYMLSRRADELQSLGLARPPPMLLPGLHVPHVVGAGMCRMLTGGMPAKDSKQYERRPNRDHPDFSKCTVDVARAGERVGGAGTLLATDRGPDSLAHRDVGGFHVSRNMPPAAMDAAADYCRVNRAGAVNNTDQPARDPLVLRQLHHSMVIRHRQHIAAVPEAAETRARAQHEMLATARDLDGEGSDNNHNHRSTAGGGAHLPRSALLDAEMLPPRDRTTAKAALARGDKNDCTSTRRGAPPAGDAPPVLLRIPVPRDAFRRKNDIKRHHEAMHTTGGKVMMRGVKAT